MTLVIESDQAVLGCNRNGIKWDGMGWDRCEKRAGRFFLAVRYGKLLNSLHCTDGDRGRVIEIFPRVSNFLCRFQRGGQ